MKKIFLIVLLSIASLCSAQFVVQNTPTTNYVNSISSPSNSVAWASGPSQQLIRTTTSGESWISALGNIPSTLRFIDIWAQDSLTAHLSATGNGGTEAYIFKTSDGGTTWQQKFFQSGGFINATFFINSLTGFASGDPVGGRWTFLKTSDGGNTWDSSGMYLSAPAGEVGVANCLFYAGNKIWFGTQSGKIYYSANSGNNWVITDTYMTGVQSIFFNDAATGRGFAADNYYENDTTLLTTFDGISWIMATPPDLDRIPGLTGIPGSSNYWITKASSIYRTTNNGDSWHMVYNNLPPNPVLLDICASRSGPSPRNIYVCRNDGKIVKGNADVSSGIELISIEVPDRFELKQNFPNPFNPTTKIIFNLRNSGNVSLKIYNQSGQLISELVNEYKTPGSYSVDFDGSNFPSGVYFYKMQSGTTTDTKKMILIK